MLKVIAHRPVQAAVIAILAALVTACAIITPLYQRALDQASVRVELDHAPPGVAVLQVSSSGVLPTIYTGPGDTIPALTAAQLVDLVPRSMRRSLEQPVAALSVDLTMPDSVARPTVGSLVARDGACAHLDVTGRCPSAAREIAVSAADAENFDLRPGMQVDVLEKQPDVALGAPVAMTLSVTGVYRVPEDPYWGGWSLTGASGESPDRKDVFHDTWVTDHATFEGPSAWRNPSTRIDLRPDPATTHLDQLLGLGTGVRALQSELTKRSPYGAVVRVESGLPDLAAKVREAQDQSRITIPALMVPLGLLGLVVLWMALGAAVEQRRPEVAVARLRGHGVRGAQAHVLRELVPVVLCGVPLGLLAALGLSWLARHLVLPGHAPSELRGPVWIALAISVVLVTATTLLVTAGITREPIVALLRKVPVRRSGWSLGTLDATVVTVAALTLGAFSTGRLTGPVALAAPAVLALAAGLMLGRVLAPLATAAGRRLLARGRTGAGVALLQLARRPGIRATIALLTVSASILVFAADAVAVGSRNRELAAEQHVGAPMVATVTGGSVNAVRDAITSSGVPSDAATPVVVHHPLSSDDQTSLFVDPAAFGRIATLPAGSAARDALRDLTGPDVAPIDVVGTVVTLRVGTESFYDGSDPPVDLAVQLLGHDGVPVSVPLGPLPAGTSAPHRVEVRVPCADGCALTGWKVSTDPANVGSGRFTVAAMRVDGRPVPLGATSDWRPTDHDGVRINALAADPESVTVFVDNPGASEVVLQHRWVPAVLPAVISGALPDDGTRKLFAGTGLDGVDRSMTTVARVPWLPAAGPRATVSDLDLATRTGAVLDEEAELQIWFAREDARTLAVVTKAVEDRHMAISAVERVSRVRTLLDDSAATWSLQLGILVGVASLVVAALGLAVAGAASWRPRSRDLAILRLSGLPARDVRRISLGEQLPAIVAAVLTGAAGGILAAHFALPTLPLLPADPAVDLLDLSTVWDTALVLTGLTAVVLCGFGVLVSAVVSRRATPDRVVGAS